MKNSKIIRFVLMMAVLMQSGISLAAEAVVSAPVAPIVSPATPSGVPGGAWYERHPKIALSLAGLGMSVALYGRAWWSNRQFSKATEEKLKFNALEINPFKIQNFALNDFDRSGHSYPNFIEVKLDGAGFGKKFRNFAMTNKLFMENGDLSKGLVCAQALREVEELQAAVIAANERTGLNNVIKDCCIRFADQKKWPNKHIDRDYYTDLFNVMTQCKEVEDFQALDALIVTKIMTSTWKSVRSPFYKEMAMQHWELMKKYIRTRYIWTVINKG